MHTVDAASMMERIEQIYQLIALSPSEPLHTISQAVEIGLAGCLIYDALFIAYARKINVKAIYTHNIKHFRQIAPTWPLASFSPDIFSNQHMPGIHFAS